MYKSTSRSEQRAGRLSMADLCGGEFADLTLEQQRENLVARYKKLTSECAALPRGPRKKEMGQQIAAIAQRISEIRPKRKGPPDLGTYFMDVAREELTKAQFTRWVDEATKRHAAAVSSYQSEAAE